MKTIEIKNQYVSATGSKLVTKYLDVKNKLRELEKERDFLKQKIDFRMSQTNVSILYYKDDYVESIITTDTVVNGAKLQKLVSEKEFLSCVKVSVKNTRDLIGASMLEKISNIKTGNRLVTGKR